MTTKWMAGWIVSLIMYCKIKTLETAEPGPKRHSSLCFFFIV